MDYHNLYLNMLELAYKWNPEKYYKFLRWLNEKAFQDEIKDESVFFNWDSEINPHQYDFNYRQDWAINNWFNI